MNLHNHFIEFIKDCPEFHEPIREAFTPEADIDDPRVLKRICYQQSLQDSRGLPYLVFTGPLDYDPGLVSEGAISLKRGKYWITVYHSDLELVLDWINAIANAVIALFVPGYYFTTTGGRIARMMEQPNSRLALDAGSNLVRQTGEELSQASATVCFEVAWYAS